MKNNKPITYEDLYDFLWGMFILCVILGLVGFVGYVSFSYSYHKGQESVCEELSSTYDWYDYTCTKDFGGFYHSSLFTF